MRVEGSRERMRKLQNEEAKEEKNLMKMACPDTETFAGGCASAELFDITNNVRYESNRTNVGCYCEAK